MRRLPAFLALLAVAAVAYASDACAGTAHAAPQNAAPDQEQREAELRERSKRASHHRRETLRAVAAVTEDLPALLMAIELDALRPDGAKRGLDGFEAWRERRSRLYARLLDLHPDENLVRHRLATFCGHVIDPPKGRPCDGYDAIRAYADADPRNASPWLLWSRRAQAAGDTVEMWWAIERAAQAERADIYTREAHRAILDFIANTVEPGARVDDYERGISFFGYVLADSVNLDLLKGPCDPATAGYGTLTSEQSAWCFRIGELLALGASWPEAHAGLRFMKAHAKSAAQRARAERTGTELDAIGQARMLLDIADLTRPTATERAAFVAYVGDWVEHGEVEAARRLVQREGYALEDWIAATREGAR